MMSEGTFVPKPVYKHEHARVETLALVTASALRHLLTLLADPDVDRKELARVGKRISVALETFSK